MCYFNHVQVVTLSRFQTVMRSLRVEKERLKNSEEDVKDFQTKQFTIVRLMLYFLPLHSHDFLLFVLEENICGSNRLNTVVNFRYFGVSEWIVTADLFDENPNYVNVQKAIAQFPPKSTMEVLKFLAVNCHAPEVILRRMRREDCFRKGFDPVVRHCTEEKVRDFISIVCNRLDIGVPKEAKQLFVRVALGKPIEAYRRGELENEDIRRIVVRVCEEDDDTYECCVRFVNKHLPLVAQYLCQIKGIPFPDAHENFGLFRESSRLLLFGTPELRRTGPMKK